MAETNIVNMKKNTSKTLTEFNLFDDKNTGHYNKGIKVLSESKERRLPAEKTRLNKSKYEAIVYLTLL
jgi:hypothetical protein